MQQFGLDHYKDLATSIPRAEIDALLKPIRPLLENCGVQKWKCTGGFIRGKPSSHDIDILFCGREDGQERVLLQSVVDSLKRENLLQNVVLSGPSHHSSVSGQAKSSKFLGVFRCDSIASGRMCRIDLISVPPSQWPFAVLGWSGNEFISQSSHPSCLFWPILSANVGCLIQDPKRLRSFSVDM